MAPIFITLLITIGLLFILGVVFQSAGDLAGFIVSVFTSDIHARCPHYLSLVILGYLGEVTWLEAWSKYDTYNAHISIRCGCVLLYLYLFLSWVGRRVGRSCK